jgi:ribosomal-protein-alanine N-acetyltransferase
VSPPAPPSAAIEVRPLRLEDIPDVAAIHVEAFREPGPESQARAETNLREELARAWAYVRVAACGDQVVGAAVIWVVADEVHVLDIATHSDHRRRGVGMALVRAVLDVARELKAIHLYLEVRRSNLAAILLYRRIGFAAVGVRSKYYSDDEDAVEMALGLDPVTGDVVQRADDVDVGRNFKDNF